MKTLVISDIHNRYDVFRNIITSRAGEYDKIVFLGDVFDNFHDTLKDVERTAEYLGECLARPDFVWIAGNHDLPYIYRSNSYLRCSGNTSDKAKVIREVLGTDLYKYVLYHWDEYFLYTHAGLLSYFLPIEGWSPEWMEKRCAQARINAESTTYDPLLGAGLSRGGREIVGGITWADYEEDFIPVEGLNQIFGHTVGKEVRRSLAQESVNYCLDTNNKHIALVENGKVNIESFR